MLKPSFLHTACSSVLGKRDRISLIQKLPNARGQFLLGEGLGEQINSDVDAAIS